MTLVDPDYRYPCNPRPAILAAVLSLLVFAVSLRGTFIYDDIDVFKLDPRLHQTSQWPKFWTESYNGGVDNLYRPLVSMSYALQWLIHGDENAWPFHLVNWLLHALVAALVAEMARRLMLVANPSRGPDAANCVAYVAGILFALHPLHVEDVANIVGRAELMCAAGVIGAIVLMLHRPMTYRRVAAIFGCCVVGVLSKEQGLLLPPILLVLARLIVRPPPLRKPMRTRQGFPMAGVSPDAMPAIVSAEVERERRAWVALLILICWTFAGYIIFREEVGLRFSWDRGFLDTSINPLARKEADRFLIPIAIAGRYTALLVAPFKLSPDYGGSVIGYRANFSDGYIWIGIAAIGTVITLLALLVRAVMKSRPSAAVALFCLVSAILAYGLISNFILLIGTNFGERLMYLPTAFLAVLGAMALAKLPRRSLICAMTLIGTAMSIRTVTYAQQWNDRTHFYELAAAQQPKSVRLHMLIISDRQTRGDLNGAADEAMLGRAVLPDYNEIWIQSADVALAQGNVDQARDWLEYSLKFRSSLKAIGRLAKLNNLPRPATTQSTAK